MAHFEQPTDDDLSNWRDWLASCPECVRKVAERFEPWGLYRMKSTGHRVTIASFYENGTVKVSITGEFNAGLLFERDVFGVDPDDLEPCELPAQDKVGGTVLTASEAEDNIDLIRATIRPDLFPLASDAVVAERDACASLVDQMPMAEILLACGEMSAQERRLTRALTAWLSHRIRNRVDSM